MIFKIRYQEPNTLADVTVYDDFNKKEQADTFARFITNNGVYRVEYVTVPK